MKERREGADVSPSSRYSVSGRKETQLVQVGKHK